MSFKKLQLAYSDHLITKHYLHLHLQAFEQRLHGLEGFLKEYQQRRRSHGGRSRNTSLYGDVTASGATFVDQAGTSTPAHSGAPPSKRPRLEEAAKQEDQRCANAAATLRIGSDRTSVLSQYTSELPCAHSSRGGGGGGGTNMFLQFLRLQANSRRDWRNDPNFKRIIAAMICCPASYAAIAFIP